MSVVAIAGWEDTFDLEHLIDAGTPVISTSITANGSRGSILLDSASAIHIRGRGDDGEATNVVFDDVDQYFSIYFRLAGAVTTSEMQWAQSRDKDGVNALFDLFFDTSERLLLKDADDTTIFTSSNSYNDSKFHWFKLRVEAGASGNWSVDIDDGLDTGSGTSNFNSVNHGFLSLSGSANGEVYIDDLLIDNAAFPTKPYSIRQKLVGGDGNYTDWTASSGTRWETNDEVASDDETTHITESDDPGRNSFTLEDAGAAGYVEIGTGPLFVYWCMKGRKFTNPDTTVRPFLRQDSSDSDEADANFNNSATYHPLCYPKPNDPQSGSPWTWAELDSVELGILHNQGQTREVRLTKTCLMVAYELFSDLSWNPRTNEPVQQKIGVVSY